MGKRSFDLILSLLILSWGARGQTILFSESFETDGNGTRYTIFGGFSDNVGDYFVRTDGQNTVDGYKKPSNLPKYTGQDSLYFFAGEDTENPDNPNGATSGILVNDINISGYDSLLITGLFACGAKPKFDPPDYVHILVDLDNSGSWNMVGSFEADINSGTNSSHFGLDTDFDGIQDSTLLDTAFTEFSFPIPGLGSLLDIKIELYLTAGDEEAAFDFIRLSGMPTGNILAPGAFTATTKSTSEIDLNWNLNANGDSVLVAFSVQPTNTDPTNGIYYNPGDTIPGGLTVIYRGNGNAFQHMNRNAGTTYYYRAWSIHNGNYSAGTNDSTTTAFVEPSSYSDSFRVQLSGLNAIIKWADPVLTPGSQPCQGYLIVGGTTANLQTPVDGVIIPEDSVLKDGQAVKYVWGNADYYVFQNLEILSTYYFKIFPFTNSGTLIDYKISGTPPMCQTLTTNRTVDLFFSEYIEGSSYNKALELFNPSPDSVDLTHYRIRSASGGGGWSSQFRLSGKIPPNDIYVIVHSSAGNLVKAVADTTLGSGVMAFNGDDARLLEKSEDNQIWVPLDIIGDPDHDPGSGWSVGGVTSATQNHTLVRKKTVSCGNINWNTSSGTDSSSSEWYVDNKDMFSNLGSHQWELVKLTETGQSTHVLEGGSADSYSIVLWIQPTATVTINLNSDNQVNVNPSSISFDSTNWSTQQLISIVAVDDAEAEGDHNGYISHTIVSEDGFFNSYPIPDLTILISDNDVAGISIDPNPDLHQITEGDQSLSYTLVLNTKPTGDVTVSVSLVPSNQATVSPSILTFNDQSWNVPQPVSLSAVDDSIVEKQDTLLLVHQINSSDSNYAQLAMGDIRIILNDNDIYSVLLNEIMYNSQGNDEEWLELYCAEPGGIHFSQDWVLRNSQPAWEYTFQSGKTVNYGAYFTIQVGSSGDFPFAPDTSFSTDANQLNNTGSTLTLTWDNRMVDSVSYSDSSPWPVGADGQGYSLELKSTLLDNALGSNWQASYLIGGTPGEPNSKDTIGPQVTSIQISDSNSYVDVSFSEGVFRSDSGVGGLGKDCFSVDILGGNATYPVLDTITKSDGTYLVGGEEIIRIFFSYTGVSNGSEILQINPAKNRIFDSAGNPASESQPVHSVTLHDQLPPILVSSTPRDDSIGVDITSDIKIWFNENIRAGPGKIFLKYYADLSTVEVFSAGADLTLKEEKVVIHPSSVLEYDTQYCIMIDDTAFSDVEGNYFIGIQEKDVFNFTTSHRPNTAPQITSGGQLDSFQVSIPENRKEVLIVSAEDAENDKLTFGLEGGEDVALFQIDAVSGLLEFITAPDYEHPKDSDSNNVYNVVVIVSDSGANPLTDSQTISAHVTNVDDDAPVVMSSFPNNGAVNVPITTILTITFNENVYSDSGRLSIYRYSDNQLFQVFGTSDFQIDTTELSVKPQNSFDYGTSYYVTIDSLAIVDSLGNHFYGIQDKNEFHFTTVQKTNSAPMIISNAGVDSITVTVVENQQEVIKITANDIDGDPLKYTLSGGQDVDCFTIDSLNGDLRFKELPDYENPMDSDKDNQYQCIVTVYDSGGLADSQVIYVIVTDQDETPPTLTFEIPGARFNSVTNQNPILLRISFDETIATFTVDSIGVSNGLIDTTNWLFVSGEDSARISVLPDSEGMVILTAGHGTAIDMSGNLSLKKTFEVRYDHTSPAVELSSSQAPVTNDSIMQVLIHFSENIFSFSEEDFKPDPDCKLSMFTGLNLQDYIFKWEPDKEFSYRFFIKQGVASDSAGNLNQPSDTLIITYDTSSPSFVMGTPDLCREDSNSFSFLVGSNEEGYAWYSVFAGSGFTTDPQDIKTDSGQVSVLHRKVEVQSGVIDTVTVGGLKKAADYHVCIVLEDRAGNLSTAAAVIHIRKLGILNDLFFSEYLEGSGSNKAVEIYNPTGIDIDLENYRLEGWHNGVERFESFIFPETVVVRSKDVLVVMNKDIDTSLLVTPVIHGIFTESEILNFDGNDVLELMAVEVYTSGNDTIRDATVVDVIGEPGVQSNQGWAVAGVDGAATDHTLIRKSTVQAGVVDWSFSSGSNLQNSEWVIYPVDYGEDLGFHKQSNHEKEIYFTAEPFDTVVYQEDPTLLFPNLDIQGLAPDSTLSSGTIRFIGWKAWEDSFQITTYGEVQLDSKRSLNESIEYILSGSSPCSDYIQTLKSLSYFHRPLAGTDHLVEVWTLVKGDSLKSYPLCRYLEIKPKPLSTQNGCGTYAFQLGQNYPNPFNPATWIGYELPAECEVWLTVYNLHGQRVCRLDRGIRSAGRHSVQWFGKNDRGEQLSSGVYLYRLKAVSRDGLKEWEKTKKLVYLK